MTFRHRVRASLHRVLPGMRLAWPLWAVLLTWIVWMLIPADVLHEMPEFVLILKPALVFFYGLYRGLRFRFLADKRFAQWLQLTPWNPPTPPPFQSVFLVWQDAAILIFVLLFGAGWSLFHLALSALLFLAGYLLPHTAFLLQSQSVIFPVVVLWAWGALLLVMRHSPAWAPAFLLLLLIYGTVRMAIREQLIRFSRSLATDEGISRPELHLPSELVQLVGREDDLAVPTRASLAAGLLAGWWTFVGLGMFPPTLERQLIWSLLFAGLVTGALLGRLKLYLENRTAPVSFRRRIASGRFLFPGYDRVFVVPLLILLYGAAAGILQWNLGNPPSAAAVAVGGLVLLVLVPGPTLRNWRLTGHHIVRSHRVIEPTHPQSLALISKNRSRALTVPSFLRHRQDTWFERWYRIQLLFLTVVSLTGILIIRYGTDTDWKVGGVLLLMFAVPVILISYAAGRVTLFHPAIRPGYREWLQTVPWTGDLPLPIGPVELRGRDLLYFLVPVSFIIAGAVLMSYRHGELFPLFLAWKIVLGLGIILVLIYLANLAGALRQTGEKESVVLGAYGMGALVLLWPQMEVMALVVALMYVTAVSGLGRSWKNFPWSECDKFRPPAEREKQEMLSRLDWLLPAQPLPAAPPVRLRLFQVGLAAWLTFAAVVRIPERHIGFLYFAYAAAVLLIAISCAYSYQSSGFRSPVSPLRRLTSGRLLIPRYDARWGSPVAAFLAGVLLPTALDLTGLGLPLALSLGLAAALSAKLFIGPTGRKWRLTGGWSLAVREKR